MKDIEKVFEQIGKEIAEMKKSVISREIVNRTDELLKENGVVVNVTECICDDVTETSFHRKYGASIMGLDFSEHDKPFLETIKNLEKEIENFENETCETCYKENMHMITQGQVEAYRHENEALKQRIDELEFENKNLNIRIFQNETKNEEKDDVIVWVRVPATPIEIATHLINNTCTINELEIIAEHLLVYCKHNREQE